MTEALVRAVAISVSFEQNGRIVHVLDDISVAVNSSNISCIIGPSGCGKSTLLRVIAGELRPQRGSIELHARMKPASPRKEDAIAYMAQDDRLQFFRTALQNVLLPCELSGAVTPEKIGEAKALMDSAGLTGFENSKPHELSGGMQQRCLMLRHFMLKRMVYLFDEPFAALDIQTVDRMSIILDDFRNRTSAGIVLVLHDIAAAAALGDVIYVLSERPARVLGVHRPSKELIGLSPSERRLQPGFDSLVLAVVHSLGHRHGQLDGHARI